jgi:hypothetical protein
VDPVVYWLREGSRGHCELFASAFVLLARDAGYAARMVVGFAGGSWNAVEDYFVVRNREAHAWVEIYDRESQEWLRVDPTPGSGSSDPDAPSRSSLQFEVGWTAWLDSLRIQWYRRVVNFEQSDQIEIASSLKELAQDFSERFSLRVNEVIAALKAWLSQPLSAGNFVRALVAVFLLLALFLLWRVRYALMALLFKHSKRAKALDPVRRQSSQYIRRLREAHGEAALDFPVMRELQRLRFGPQVEADQAKQIFARARKVMRRST